MNAAPYEQWHEGSGPALFDADFKAWWKKLDPHERAMEAHMHWVDLGPFAHSTYSLHLALIGSYRFMLHRNQAPKELPDDCTPEGFYLKAVANRRRQVGVTEDTFVPTPYERLSSFSHFIYERITERIALAAGFASNRKAPNPSSDGLEDDDDGLGGDDDGLSIDDGLGLDDGLDDGLGDGL